MKEDGFCPHCDKLVDFEFSDDYYMQEEGCEADTCICPKCGKEVSISFETKHQFTFTRKGDL